MRNNVIFMLLGALAISPSALAQDEDVEVKKEEREVEIRMESLGGAGATVASGQTGITTATYPDKSLWHISPALRTPDFYYCWVDEDNEPRCKKVAVED